MTNYPRQVDASLQQQQQHMEDTRKATPVSDTIDASDIQHLLAAINKQEARGKVQVPADHSIKRAPGVPEPWKLLLNLLRECQKSIKDFFAKGGLRPHENFHVIHFAKWETYLRKIGAIMNDVDVLLRAATSSRCRHLFDLKFKQHLIPSISSKAQIIPRSAKDWEAVLEKALAHQNHQTQVEPKVMRIPWIKSDTAYMAGEVIGRDLVVHCEAKVLIAIARAEAENRHLAKAYSYVGVSKLSCRGCHAFFQAYNRAHGTRFITKGSHGKSYWPWQFPQNFAKSQETVEYMYDNLVESWVNSYDGYVPEMVQLEPDSTAGSQASRTVDWDDDPDSLDQMNEYLKTLKNFKNR